MTDKNWKYHKMEPLWLEITTLKIIEGAVAR